MFENPTLWKTPHRKPRTLKLELECPTLKKAMDARWGIIEALREIGYTQKDWKFKTENSS